MSNSNTNMKGIVLAAGKGIRLSSISDGKPKPLLKIGDRLLIEHMISQLVQAGVKDLILITREGYTEEFKKTIGDGKYLGVESLVYVQVPKENDNILDTIYAAKPYLDSEKVICTCDVLIDGTLNEAVNDFKKQENGIRLVSSWMNDTAGFSLFEENASEVTNFLTKDKNRHREGYIDLGFWMLDKNAFKVMERLLNESSSASTFELVKHYVKNGKAYHTDVDGWWSDVGNSIEEFSSVNEKYSRKDKQGAERLSFGVGIPSYKSGESIVSTVKSLQKSKGVGSFEITVVVNDVMNSNIQKKLENLGVKVLHNKENIGQTGSNNRIFGMAKTDLLIMTQDDVLFEPHTLRAFIDEFELDPDLTMVAPKFVPLSQKTLVEKVVNFGSKVNRRIVRSWNHGDNYLSAVGRCLGYRTSMVKRFEIDDAVINCDAYYYFENRRLGGEYKFVENAEVKYRLPNNVDEHLKQVRKFVVSQDELSGYLKTDLREEYNVPKKILLKALSLELIKNPIYGTLYFLLTVYSRTRPKSFYKEVTRFWDIDTSTKNL